ncbi:hypothetical protein cypCar_00045965 [Cyprinus carpio]|nr:hypothetical protein cypCar_00045965 [Cyprinus carpio]
MVPLFSLFILFLKTSCICSWLADKCLFYSDVQEFPVATTCAGKTNIAECHHVTNIKEDLRGLPSNLLNLCIQMERDFHGALAPDSFSRFASLEYLEIVGCFSEIPPEAFNELTNVTSLKLSFLSTAICCEVALDFSRLSSLNHLSLSQYSLSSLAPNVFEMIPQLQKLKILNVCLKDISEVVCRLAKAKSLKLFKLEEYDLNRLHYPNCSVFNISDGYISTEFDIEETLILTNCRMFFLDGSLTKDLKALTGLVLMPKDNVNVLQNFVEHLTSLKYLHLLGLGLYCNCDNAWLVSWAKDNRKVQVAMSRPTMKELQCLTYNGIDHLNFVDYSKTCLSDIEFVFFTFTSGFLSIFIIVVLSYKFAGQYIAPFYHIASGWLREALHVNCKHQYRYDVFVSYSGKDEHWVMEELLPNLEQRGPPFLRLCLHSRDFQLGQDIVENITDSIYASRRTLCLISRNYIGSNWCSLEMQLATYRLQVEHRDILILVFLEMIPSRLLSSHHRLARLVKTRTYLDWPREPEMQEAFWDRLWCKLSSNKTN